MTRLKDIEFKGQGGSTEPPAPTEGGFFNGSRTRHGTESGHRLHLSLKEIPCESCRVAKSYHDWRRLQATPVQARNRARARAQNMAQAELVRRHLAEYDELYEVMVRKVYEERDLGEPRFQKKKNR